MPRTKISPETRFWGKVKKGPDCWIWQGTILSNGYGIFSISSTPYNRQLAHRYSYILHKGPIENHIDHLCRVRNCVNPAHLEDVTQAENNRRSIKGKRGVKGEDNMIKYTLYLTKIQLKELSGLDGTVSEHIRRAIDKYLAVKATRSPSK